MYIFMQKPFSLSGLKLIPLSTFHIPNFKKVLLKYFSNRGRIVLSDFKGRKNNEKH